jgi:hypothetical protein
MTLDPRKAERRATLLTDALDALVRVGCQMPAMCTGPKAPPRSMHTCYRCQILHRAFQMGLIDEVFTVYGAHKGE